MDSDVVAIRAIDPGTIHKIQSGQVIVDLCSVAKELVENSLDAGATIIDVRFKNQGLDSIEVQDNGGGISPENYESIALKHYTSKLSTYADLTALRTFGFRGEALSSLCALSRFTIVTCLQSEAPKAKKLEFESSGALRSANVVAGQRGSTACVEDLFFNLPVRRRELERNIKREWGKVISLLHQYACVQTGLKLSVWQQPNKGKRMLLFSTKGNKTTKDNIVNVFGAKTLTALITLDLRLELEATQAPGSRRTDPEAKVHEIRVVGHVSRPVHGGGRQTPDRQMFYVNGRPCGLPQFAKVFNEVYRSFNSSQSPFIFADIQLDTDLYDVNVSPDKRTILLHDQGKMLDHLRDKLVELFETQEYTVPKAELVSHRQTPIRGASVARGGTPAVSQQIEPLELSQQKTGAVADVDIAPGGDMDSQSRHEDDERSSVQSKEPGVVAEFPPIESISGVDLEDEQHADSEGGGEAIKTFEQEKGEAIQTFEQEKGASGKDKLRERSAVRSQPPSAQGDRPSNSTLSRWLVHGRRSQSTANQSNPNAATSSSDDPTTTIHLVNAIKRGRLDNAGGKGGKSKRTKVENRPRALPTFGGRLSQIFAANSRANHATAPSTNIEDENDDDENDDDENEDGNDDGDSGDGSSEHTEAEDHEDMELELSASGDAAGNPKADGDEAGFQTDREDEVVTPSHASRGSQLEEPEHDSIVDTVSQASEPRKPGTSQQEAGLYSSEDLIGLAEKQRETAVEEGEKRAHLLVKGSRRREGTHQTLHRLRTDEEEVAAQLQAWQAAMETTLTSVPLAMLAEESTGDPEALLSLKISKSDFAKMKIIGQFNLGFVLGVRPANSLASGESQTGLQAEDDLFIIDQHASDEKYNFERLQANTVVQSQRLVQPKVLELTAVEEEIVMENLPALQANGFVVKIDDTGTAPVGSRVQLLNLPLSRETTFTLADLEELIFLLGDNPTTGSGTPVPRPSRTRKMFAMRACRSSIMIGRALSDAQMQKVVRHMGEMEKPWNCPHGRPTMRHLCGLGSWDGQTWSGDHPGDGAGIDWAAYLRTGR